MNHSSQFGPPYLTEEKRHSLSVVFILDQSGGLTAIDKYLLSFQAFILPPHESSYKRMLTFSVAMAIFVELYIKRDV